MNNEGYLFAANIAVWLGVCGYLLFLGSVQKRLAQRLARMEMLRDDAE